MPASDTLFRIMTAVDRKSLDVYASSLAFDLTPPQTIGRFFSINCLFPPRSRPSAYTKLRCTAQGGGV